MKEHKKRKILLSAQITQFSEKKNNFSFLKRVQDRNFKKPNNKDIDVFLKQLSGLLKAGIPLVDCFSILQNTQEKQALSSIITQMKIKLEKGNTFSSVISIYSNLFNSYVCQLIQVGEKTGDLCAVLDKILMQREKYTQLNNKVKKALFYPCMILFMALCMMSIMLIYIVPRFALLFEQIQTTLPIYTRILFFISLNIRNHIFLIFFLLFITISLVKYFLPFKTFALLLKQIPFIRHLTTKIVLLHFAYHFAFLLEAGISMSDSLETFISYSHSSLTEQIRRLKEKILSGEQLHQAMESSVKFPPLMRHLVKIGETTGTLEKMLFHVATLLELETDRYLQHMTELLEPLIMVFLGVVIGGMVIALYVPIFNLGTAL